MTDLDKLWAELDELRKAKAEKHEAWTKSVDAEHAKIREILAAGPRGIRDQVIKRTGYAPGHIDRIRRGISSGNLSPGTGTAADAPSNPEH